MNIAFVVIYIFTPVNTTKTKKQIIITIISLCYFLARFSLDFKIFEIYLPSSSKLITIPRAIFSTSIT